jgi:23S rRNA (cytidine1920-2'-O)/16S rRNA (cytidine1409-2'-O)-methyltransferase
LAKKRIDTLLVDRGLAETRSKAQALVMAGDVLADGKTVIKAGTLVDENAELSVAGPPRFVGRGGIKLDHALDVFNLDVSDAVAADIGASTGGFTDCLLQRGAGRVYAIDVGYGQLDYRLRQDPRVVVMERVNARYAVDIPEKVAIIVMDVSFISVEKVIPSAAELLKDSGNMVVLLKPQFEAKKAEVGRGGIVKDPDVHARVLGRFVKWVVGSGFRLRGLAASPVEGASGNREFFVLLRKVNYGN